MYIQTEDSCIYTPYLCFTKTFKYLTFKKDGICIYKILYLYIHLMSGIVYTIMAKKYLLYIHSEEFATEQNKSALVNELLRQHYAGVHFAVDQGAKRTGRVKLRDDIYVDNTPYTPQVEEPVYELLDEEVPL